MLTIADGVLRIPLAPRNALSAYLIGGTVLVDTGMPHQRKRMVSALEGIDIRRIVLTHAHVDHAGTVAGLTAEKGSEVLCGGDDLDALAAGTSPPIALGRFMDPVQRAIVRYRGLHAVALRDGDEVGHGFVAVATPGHTDGHHSLWRERDRVLIAGDALIGVGPMMRAGVFAPPRFNQSDPPQVRESIRRLAQLRPDVIAFGHGPVLRDDAAARLTALAAAQP